ncbi:MAG: GNAT family N-acetyltransferase [Anaerolineaceae bacterium]|nr:GNAT family N-acetyltransferase [Anaerolineaceae bacterium]
MEIQPGVFALNPADYPRTIEVWETSVRATHDFVAEADIHVFRPIVAAALPVIENLACVRDHAGQLAGFVAVVNGKVEMLFLDPRCRGQGAGRRLLEYAINAFDAVELDVNEQNPQAIGFYLHLGFEVVGRSELDGTGKPYPLLHMRLGHGATS